MFDDEQIGIPQLVKHKGDIRVNVARINCDGDVHLIPTDPDDTKEHHDTVDCWCRPRLIYSCALRNVRQWMHLRYNAPGSTK